MVKISGIWNYICPNCESKTSFSKLEKCLNRADLGGCKDCTFPEAYSVRRSENLDKGKWQVACRNCKKPKYFTARSTAIRGYRGSCLCRSCAQIERREQRRSYPTQIEKHLRKAKLRAEGSGRYVCEIDAEYLKTLWTGYCIYSGMPIEIDKNASIERIDSDLGYVLDNVAWIHKDINRMKLNYKLDYYIEMCKKVAEHNG